MKPENLLFLRKGIQELGIELSEDQIKKLADYLTLLLKWNRVFNLTSIKSEEEGVKKHLLDCLAIIPEVSKLLVKSKEYTFLDVGSGGGLPAVALAVCFPQIRIVSVDAVAKKTTFIKQAALQLGLKNWSSEHARVEDMTEVFDFVTSRAFASLKLFTDLSAERLKDGGTWIAMKGKYPQEEMEELETDVCVESVTPLRVPGLPDERCLVLMKKASGI